METRRGYEGGKIITGRELKEKLDQMSEEELNREIIHFGVGRWNRIDHVIMTEITQEPTIALTDEFKLGWNNNEEVEVLDER